MKKTILIAGANSELAVSIIDKLDKKFQLVLLYRDKIKRLPKKNKKIIYIKVDYFRNFQDALIKKLKQKKLSISSIIHFNGTHKFSTINSLSINDFREVYDINCLTFIQLVKLAKAQYCFKELESILTISSVSSFNGNKAISLYSSSKAALNNLVKSFALELSKKKIRVNSIVLGHIEKGMGKKTEFFLDKDQITLLKNQHPLGFGNVEDLFYSIDFFLDKKKSRWITGTNFILDGGYLA